MYVQNGNSCKTMLKRYFRDKRLARVEYVVNMERALLRARSAACSSYCLSRPLSSGCQTALEYAVRLDYVMPNWPLLTAEAALQFDFRWRFQSVIISNNNTSKHNTQTYTQALTLRTVRRVIIIIIRTIVTKFSYRIQLSPYDIVSGPTTGGRDQRAKALHEELAPSSTQA